MTGSTIVNNQMLVLPPSVMQIQQVRKNCAKMLRKKKNNVAQLLTLTSTTFS